MSSQPPESSPVAQAFASFVRTGHPGDLSRVFDEPAPELLRVSRHLVRDLSLAEALVQSTFLVAIVRGGHAIRALEPVIWLVVGATAAPSLALWTWVGARIGVARAFALACLVEAVGVAASVLWIAAPGVVLAAALLGGTFVGITALGLDGARRLTRGDSRRVLALMTAAFGLGQIVGPAFAGFLFDRTGSFVPSSLLWNCFWYKHPPICHYLFSPCPLSR